MQQFSFNITFIDDMITFNTILCMWVMHKKFQIYLLCSKNLINMFMTNTF